MPKNPAPKKILIDLRCLNYPIMTGVNVYTIHLLLCLSQIPGIELVGFGLKQNRVLELENNYPFLQKLLKSYITTQKYHNKPIFSDKVLEVFNIINYQLFGLKNKNIEQFDFLILPQPRQLISNPKTKVITIIHDVFSVLDNSSSFIQKLIFNFHSIQNLINSSHLVFGNSISTCNDIQTNFETRTSIKLVYPALPNLIKIQNTNSITCKLDQFDWTTQYYLAISGIEKRKNWKNLILAHHYLNLQTPNRQTKLILCGIIVDQNYYRQLLDLIVHKSIQNIAWFLEIDETDKQKLIRNCLFLVYPSFYEGFGFPILEAFSNKKTVLTSNISSMLEIGQDSCLYVNPFDVEDIKNAIHILETDQSFRQKLEKSIPVNQFDWKELQKALESIILTN
jgi:glycosyltransferase involved in cell wall biosynthesis